MGKPRIVVADDHPAFLQKLISMLEVDFDIVATATDGKSVLNFIRRYKPDLAVLELSLPLLNGIEVSREVTKHGLQAARQAGALAYVFKMRVEKDLILAVKSDLTGKPFGSTVCD